MPRGTRRSASFEESDLHLILETEFSYEGRPDLRLSVYEVADEQAEIVRTYVQHTASVPTLGAPFRRRHHLNVSGLEPRTAVAAEVAGPFRQLRGSHREIHFADAAELRRFVGKLKDQFAQRGRLVTKQDGERYVRQQLLDGNPEWESIRGNSADWAKYFDKLVRS
jgi:hypothetical protein